MNNIIATITDNDFGLERKELNNPTIRYAARGIVINNNGEIAVFYKKNKKEYKLPGGGIEGSEEAEKAFKREVMEETGCKISNINSLGVTIEEKGQTDFKQISYIFIANVLKDTKKLHITKKEKDEGGEVLWLSPEDAYDKVLKSIDNEIGSIYDSKYSSLFMVKRDSLILKYYLDKKIS